MGTPPATIPAELVSLFGSAERGFIAQYQALLDQGSGSPSPFGTIERKFVIGFTARSGSTLLCQHLFPYGVAVAEYLNKTHIRAETHVSGAKDYHTLVSRLVETYAATRAWGVKALIDHTIPLFFMGEFPNRLHEWRFVYLSRMNIVRQAISQVIAQKTRSWASWRPQSRQVTLSDYSRDEISALIENTCAARRLWESFFTLFAIEPLRLTYEEIAADPASAADRVARHCNLTLAGEQLVEKFRRPPLLVQSTHINSAWEARFREESQALLR